MKKKMHIVYEDKEFLVIDKPSNLLTISTEKEREKTLYHQAREYIKKQNPNNKIFIVHRLDKDTSGIVLFAKTEKGKEMLQKNWNAWAIKREYIAIVEGVVTPKKGQIINYLNTTKTLDVYDSKNPKTGKKAVTDYQVLGTNKAHSLLKISIKTGRRNQIRVALTSMGHPIIGDKKYGAKKNPIHRLGLHASYLHLRINGKKEYKWVSKIPKEMKQEFSKEVEEYEKTFND